MDIGLISGRVQSLFCVGDLALSYRKVVEYLIHGKDRIGGQKAKGSTQQSEIHSIGRLQANKMSQKLAGINLNDCLAIAGLLDKLNDQRPYQLFGRKLGTSSLIGR